MRIKKYFKRVDMQASFICVLLVVGSSLAIFYVNYQITYTNIIETLQTRTDAIYNSLDSIFDSSLFDKINTKEDKQTEIYQEYQQKLLEMRTVSNVRYLYTAKKNDQGEYIYLIDGLPLDSADFRNPGDLIEEDIHENIESVYHGKIVLPDEIIDTSWGKIFLAYYPIHAGPGHTDEIIGVVGIEIDAETQYRTYHDMIRAAPPIIGLACVIAFAIFTWCFRYISNPRRKDLYNIDALTQLKNRTSLDHDFRNIYSKEEVLSIVMIDLDHLKVINDNYGHDCGDMYIRLAGQSIINVFSQEGIAYRYGGDEFVVMLDIADEKKIELLCEEVQKIFVESATELKTSVGLSIGYAIYDKEKDKNLLDTLKRADIMMYKNKKKNL